MKSCCFLLVLLFSSSRKYHLILHCCSTSNEIHYLCKKKFSVFCLFRISSKMRNFISVPVWTCSQKLNKMVYGFTSCYYFSFVRKLTCKILVNKFEKLLFYTISHNHKSFDDSFWLEAMLTKHFIDIELSLMSFSLSYLNTFANEWKYYVAVP